KYAWLCFSSYQFSASGWLTPYLADALTLCGYKILLRGLKAFNLGARGERPRSPLRNSSLVFFGDRGRHINDGQQHEDVRLKNGDHDVQSAEDNRNANWNHGKE